MIVILGVLGVIVDAKVDSSQQLFSQVQTQNNVQVMTNINAQQLTTFLQQQGFSQGAASTSVPKIMHKVSGNFNPGGAMVLEVIGAPSMAGLPFFVAFSMNGDYPGITLPGMGHLPLNPPYPAIVSGNLDAQGRGQFILPIPNDPRLCGAQLMSAGAVLNLIARQIDFSNPVTYEICKGVQGNSCCTKGTLGSKGSECTPTGGSINYCRKTVGGAVQGCIKDVTQDPPPGSNISKLKPANVTTVNSTIIDNIMKDVVESKVNNSEYNASSYDCDDFADDLEKYLTGQGHNATFTHYMLFDANNTSIQDHALTDVHLADGSILFIEPQTGKIVDLDIDQDGEVEARMYPPKHINGYHPTDDNAKITVYDSKASAVAAGLQMD